MSTRIFPIDNFNAAFPVFADSTSVYTADDIQRAGLEAMHHIAESVEGMPMEGCEDREYALFLMTAHILVLNHKTDPETALGNSTDGGSAFKSTIGSVQIEKTKPNGFTTDEWEFWLNQTEYGRRLIAYLDIQAPLGVFLNTKKASVRVLV